uniref:Predicted protein n=1 Tax=Hordeum vulgare subsp. vulgare TaxID=112509 RepID=F2D886_HORVV|nr:predicted protein [Hordeum vulgare subsp. vulgare]
MAAAPTLSPPHRLPDLPPRPPPPAPHLDGLEPPALARHPIGEKVADCETPVSLHVAPKPEPSLLFSGGARHPPGEATCGSPPPSSCPHRVAPEAV